MGNRLQPVPRIDLPIRDPKFNDGEMFFMFSKAEISKSAEPFRFSVVIKFLRKRPSLDYIRGFIKSCWNLHVMPVVGQLSNPPNVLVRLTEENDFTSVMARRNAEIHGVP